MKHPKLTKNKSVGNKTKTKKTEKKNPAVNAKPTTIAKQKSTDKNLTHRLKKAEKELAEYKQKYTVIFKLNQAMTKFIEKQTKRISSEEKM